MSKRTVYPFANYYQQILLNMTEEIIYANSFKRGFATFIDIIIASFLRIVFIEILGSLWYRQKILDFMNEFKAKFGTDVIGRVPAQIEFLTNHPIIKSTILFLILIMLVGALYHSILNSSSWSGTVGKRIMGIILINSDGRKLTFLEAFGHYLLSLFPWIYMFYIVAFQNFHGITIFKAITANPFNILFGLVTLGWVQIHSITKRKVTAHDLICKTVMVEGRVGGKWPKIFGRK